MDASLREVERYDREIGDDALDGLMSLDADARIRRTAGQREEARLWYGRVLDLWAEADAELQPTVARIRAAVNALGPPRP